MGVSKMDVALQAARNRLMSKNWMRRMGSHMSFDCIESVLWRKKAISHLWSVA
jgi:hypothetical protein